MEDDRMFKYFCKFLIPDFVAFFWVAVECILNIPAQICQYLVFVKYAV